MGTDDTNNNMSTTSEVKETTQVDDVHEVTNADIADDMQVTDAGVADDVQVTDADVRKWVNSSFEVDKIVGTVVDESGNRFYKTRWVTFSWEAEASFVEAQHLVTVFWEELEQTQQQEEKQQKEEEQFEHNNDDKQQLQTAEQQNDGEQLIVDVQNDSGPQQQPQQQQQPQLSSCTSVEYVVSTTMRETDEEEEETIHEVDLAAGQVEEEKTGEVGLRTIHNNLGWTKDGYPPGR